MTCNMSGAVVGDLEFFIGKNIYGNDGRHLGSNVPMYDSLTFAGYKGSEKASVNSIPVYIYLDCLPGTYLHTIRSTTCDICPPGMRKVQQTLYLYVFLLPAELVSLHIVHPQVGSATVTLRLPYPSRASTRLRWCRTRSSNASNRKAVWLVRVASKVGPCCKTMIYRC